MRNMRKAITFLIPLLLVSALASVGHGGLYRWVDQDGKVHYTDSIPPDQVESGHTELSKQGVRVKSVGKAKTPEEVEKEQELERLRAEQKKLLAKQRSEDQVLLRTFQSEDDIIMAREGKLTAIDVMIEVTKNNVLRQQERLVKLLGQAADLERTGKDVNENLIDGIRQVEEAIRDSYATIVTQEKQKDEIRAKFDRDLARYRQLKKLPVSKSPLPIQEKHLVLHNMVACAGPTECNRLWENAKEYVRQNATTAVQTSNTQIVITTPPTTEDDISLILSRIDDEEGPGATLFLDLQCKRALNGREVCKGKQAEAIVEGFRPALVGEETPPE
jgi:hypothetical protein